MWCIWCRIGGSRGVLQWPILSVFRPLTVGSLGYNLNREFGYLWYCLYRAFHNVLRGYKNFL